jgi:apolipoprotein N-acyltransferase
MRIACILARPGKSSQKTPQRVQFVILVGVRKIHKGAWLLVLLSALLQVLIFPLPNWYVLCWFAVTPLLVAILRARRPDTLQLEEGIKLLPASPWQAFLLAYLCGILWYAGNCYWIFNTMRQYGGLNTPAAIAALVLFCLYLGLYHGLFGLMIGLLAGKKSFNRLTLLLAPAVWVAVELARTRITGFPWDLLGTVQTDNIPLARIATVTGVYGLSFEIMVVNAALAAAFLVRRSKRKQLLLAGLGAIVVLQATRWVVPPVQPTDHTAILLQANTPILDAADWTPEYFQQTLSDLNTASFDAASQPPPSRSSGDPAQSSRLIIWPESPAPFFVNDAVFRNSLGNLARETRSWVLAGTVATSAPGETPVGEKKLYNSASLIGPDGGWTARYDKIHLVPFGEYLPFPHVFSFAGGLTKEVGGFTSGQSRFPLDAGGIKLGTFICYESIFPDEVRQFAANGADVLVNLSDDAWYGDSGAYAQHLLQTRIRAVENNRWLLSDTNTGVTASIDPYGRVTSSVPRKVRTALLAQYAVSDVTTFYTRHGDWFAYLCAIISMAGLLARVIKRSPATRSPT